MGRLFLAGTGLSVYGRLHMTTDDVSVNQQGPVVRRASEHEIVNVAD